MKIKTFVFNPFYENTLVISSEGGNCLIVDPGCYEQYELDQITAHIDSEGLEVQAIINTHCHIDHVLGNYALKNHFHVPLKIPIREQDIFKAIPAYAPQWGITGYRQAEVDEYLEEGSKLTLDELTFRLMEVPGHSPGHLVFYLANEKVLIGGDVLFKESIGRTDLPGGNHNELLTNIRQKLYTLPDEVIVYPGHGPTTTIGHEKNNNPFVRG